MREGRIQTEGEIVWGERKRMAGTTASLSGLPLKFMIVLNICRPLQQSPGGSLSALLLGSMHGCRPENFIYSSNTAEVFVCVCVCALPVMKHSHRCERHTNYQGIHYANDG